MADYNDLEQIGHSLLGSFEHQQDVRPATLDYMRQQADGVEPIDGFVDQGHVKNRADRFRRALEHTPDGVYAVLFGQVVRIEVVNVAAEKRDLFEEQDLTWRR